MDDLGIDLYLRQVVIDHMLHKYHQLPASVGKIFLFMIIFILKDHVDLLDGQELPLQTQLLYIGNRTFHRSRIAGCDLILIRFLQFQDLRMHHKTELSFDLVAHRRLPFICADQFQRTLRLPPLYGMQNIALVLPRHIVLDIQQIFIQVTGDPQSAQQTVPHVFGNRALPFLDPCKLGDCHQSLCQLFQINIFFLAHPFQELRKVLIRLHWYIHCIRILHFSFVFPSR